MLPYFHLFLVYSFASAELTKFAMRLLILYGSQTGTAQDVAEQLWRNSKKYGFEGPVLPMDDYPIRQLLDERLVFFVAATTGDGDEPENMRNFWKFLLRRSLPLNSLENLQFACLGLGDSSYAKFNYAAKKLNKRLQQLGAKSLVELGLCDDQHDHGLSAVALPWMQQLWQQIEATLGVKANPKLDACSIFKWRCEIIDKSNGKVTVPVAKQLAEHILWPHAEKSEKFTLSLNQRTTALDHFQDVRLLKFDFPNSVHWSPGDILQVQPCNSQAKVNDFFAWAKEYKLDFDRNTTVQITSNHPDIALPKCYSSPITVEQMATYLWDLSFRPRQRAFEVLAINCEDELEKEKLIEFTTAEELDSLINYINRPRRTILEVLQDFPKASAKVTLNTLIELFTFIQPRSFSIASCKESGSLDLLVAVVEYKTKLSTPRIGLCSNWLKSLQEGTEIYGCIKPGTMKWPTSKLSPMIMIGPGTGIAPFRSVIQEQYIKHEKDNNEMLVFFGCRNKLKDFHFEQDFAKWQKEQFIQLFPAFSRDQDNKIYVQHLIEANLEILRPLLINKQAFVYVAGSSNSMPKAVKEAFVKVLDNDEHLLKEMQKTKRYQEETWS